MGGCFVDAHEAVLFWDEIRWCGWLTSGVATLRDLDRVLGLFGLRQRTNGDQLMRLIHR